VLLDVLMPGLSGIEIAEALLETDPTARILLSSGNAEKIVRRDVPNHVKVVGFLQKPYYLPTLERVLQEALRRPRDTAPKA
jgi:CheY-like chemotaxis protein